MFKPSTFMRHTLIIPFILLTNAHASEMSDPSMAVESELKKQKVQVPQAEARPTSRSFHNGAFTLTDDFSWLRDPTWKQAKDGIQDSQIMDYIKQEEAYTDEFLAPLKPTIDEYVKLRLAMIAEAENSYPALDHEYYYFSRTSNKTQYPVYFRFKKAQTPEDAVAYFDGNKEAEGHKFFSLSSLDVSPNGQLLAYATDTAGNEKYTVRIRNLITGAELSDTLSEINGSVTWTADNNGFYYVRRNENDRPQFIYYHVLGTDQETDQLLYTEQDETAYMGIGSSSDEQYLFIVSSTSDETGLQAIKLGPVVDHSIYNLVDRKPNRKVDIEHKDGYFYMLTNDRGDNFRLVKTAVGQVQNDHAWQEILPVDKNRYLTDIKVAAKGIAVASRNGGLTEIGVLDEQNRTLHLIPMPEKAYDATLKGMDYEADYLRFSYSSLSKPPSTIEASFDTLQTFVRKVRELPCGHNPDNYVTDRLFIDARDGVKVPVSLVYKKDRYVQDGTKPLFLYGYGSYGINIDPEFLDWILPLLDKGFVYAIANVRGGSEMGYGWYLDGKMEKKDNTFNDFIDVAQGLIQQKYTSKGNITAFGGSAGGLLMGAVANKAPELFKSMVSMVPFVDLINTMLDGSLPLTPGEYQEWGNPESDPEVYARLLSYSPYDNLSAGINYPAMYVTGGIYDFRVTYWEMLKYVAKLRHVSPETPVWLRMKTAGHGGGTALEDKLRERGEVYAFALKMHGLL